MGVFGTIVFFFSSSLIGISLLFSGIYSSSWACQFSSLVSLFIYFIFLIEFLIFYYPNFIFLCDFD